MTSSARQDSRTLRSALHVAILLAAPMFFAGPCTASSATSSDASLLDMGLDRVPVLPEYCEYSQDGKHGFNINGLTPAHQQWLAVIGPTMHHIHHYCRGLKAAQKARNPLISAQQRASLYDSVVKEAAYVVERAPADFVLLPEIYLRMGQAMLGKGDVGSALEFFDKSRRVRPDYWPAYVELARTNLLLGRRGDAVAALKSGLQSSPEEANLKQALDRLTPASQRAKRARDK